MNENETTCSGCKDGILNQLGHMEEGGCLYKKEDIDLFLTESDE